jgi:hypothetical protein
MGDVALMLRERAVGWVPEMFRGMPAVDNFLPQFSYGGRSYPLQQTLLGAVNEIVPTFEGYAGRLFKANPIVFACEMARVSLFMQARFMWQRLNSGVPGDLFSSPELRSLDRPWPKATTSDLLARMLLYADFGGNSFVVRRPGAMRPLRPDWTTVVLGSDADPEAAAWDVDADMLGIAYWPGGPEHAETPQLFLAEEFAHFAPTPDPLAPGGLGMPWVESIVREVMGDAAATEHKLSFFRNGATPNMVVTVDKAYSDPQISALRTQIQERHEGAANAYRSLVLRGAVEKVDVVGKDLQQLDFKEVQGAGETRIAAAARVPVTVIGFSEGLKGSSLNQGNYESAFRRFADLMARPAWQNAAGSLETLLTLPTTGSGGGSPCQLWYDDRHIPALKDDIKAAAEVRALDATAMRTLADGGWEPDAVIAAITSGDLKNLKGHHTGTRPVQQAAGSGPDPAAADPQPEPPTGGQ